MNALEIGRPDTHIHSLGTEQLNSQSQGATKAPEVTFSKPTN